MTTSTENASQERGAVGTSVVRMKLLEEHKAACKFQLSASAWTGCENKKTVHLAQKPINSTALVLMQRHYKCMTEQVNFSRVPFVYHLY